MATFVAALHSLQGGQLDLPQMTQYWAQFGYLDVAVLVLSFMVSKHAGYIVLNSLLARLLKISAQ